MGQYYKSKILVLCNVLLLSVFATFNFFANTNTSINELEKLISKYKQSGNKTQLAKYSTQAGYAYWEVKSYGQAISKFEESLQVNKELGNSNALKTIYSNLGLINTEMGNYSDAITNFESSMLINKSSGKTLNLISDYINMATTYQVMGDYVSSNDAIQKALSKSLEMDKMNLVKTCYGILGENHEKLGNAKKAGIFYEKYSAIAKMLQKEQMQQMQNKTSEFAQKVNIKEKQLAQTLDTLQEVVKSNADIQIQNELLNKENQLRELRLKEQKARMEAKDRMRRTQIMSLSAVILLFCLIIILFIWQFNQKKKANNLLKQQNLQIEQQKKEIEKQRDIANEQKERITSSIMYAERIQQAILPPKNVLNDYFEDAFVLFRPKDIVSGDFYWLTKKDDLLILVAADCTGHGVPGGFMSMLGIAYLNEIINTLSINKHINSLRSDEVVNQLRKTIIESLHQSDNFSEPKDGMDLAICIFDFKEMKMQFTGANNPIYLIRDNKLERIKPDRMPVSYHQKKNVPFNINTIDIKEGDRVYLFSDGYVDQFSGDNKVKFMSKRFMKLLSEIHLKPMKEQKEILNKTIDEWKGKHSQIDDILVIGLKLGKELVSNQLYSGNKDWSDKKILIAEDMDVNFFLLEEVLSSTNITILRAYDGEEAIRLIEENADVDLILMDIYMPKVNGYKATETIKSMNKEIPIIVQTAFNDEENTKKAYAVGADDFITKPVDLKTFINKIDHFF